MMKGMGYGKGYRYDHDTEFGISGQSYLPESLHEQIFYTPGELGYEKDVAKRIQWWEKLRQKARRQIDADQ